MNFKLLPRILGKKYFAFEIFKAQYPSAKDTDFRVSFKIPQGFVVTHLPTGKTEKL